MAENDLGQAILEMLNDVTTLRTYDISISQSVPDSSIQIKRDFLLAGVNELRRRYEAELQGLPEAAYLSALAQFYGAPDETINKEIFYTQIDEFKLGGRLQNRLNSAGIEYLGDLVQKEEFEIGKIWGIGRKGLYEIRELLVDIHPTLHFGMKLPDYTRPK